MFDILSDVHLESHKDGGAAWLRNHKPRAPYLILAGDLHNAHSLKNALSVLSLHYKEIFMVLGNHEFWDSSPSLVLSLKEEINREIPNVHILENETFKVEGVKIHGCTLWFPDRPLQAVDKKNMGDFQYIQGFEPWVYDQNRLSQDFLSSEVREGDIVITHHIPTFQGVSEKWRTSNLTPFFYTECNPYLLTTPSLWVYGHTHDSQDFYLGETRFLCNPYGYSFNRNKDWRAITWDG